MHATRQLNLERALQQTSEDPLLLVELNELISISFDFNFGDGQKDLLLGVHFHYKTDDSISNS